MLSAITATNTQAQENDKGGHRGLDFTVSPGYQIFTGEGGGGAVSAEVSLGKRFNKSFYWGISSGAYIPTGDGDVQIPITTDFKVLFPLNNKTFTPGILARGGYVIDPSNTDYSSIMFQAMPTVDVAIGSSVDFSLGVGYTHYVPTKGGGSGSGAVTIRTAFTFHKSKNGNRKPMGEARKRGIELTLEGGAGLIHNAQDSYGDGGGMNVNPGGNVLVSYKFNPKLNVGLGFGFSRSLGISNYHLEDGNDEHDDYVSVATKRLFVRGEYAFTTKNLAPFVSCDAGLNMYSYEEGRNEIFGKKLRSSGLFVSPAIGASFRVARNSYIKLRLGYSLTPSNKGKMEKGEYERDNGTTTENYHIDTPSFSQPYLNIGFTHTFSWGENWFK